MKILVSGFEAFGGESINPTEKLIEALNRGQIAVPPRTQIRGVLLPVTFDGAFPVLEKAIQDFSPDLVLAFGQAAGRSAIELERVAVNIIDSREADNSGAVIAERVIDPFGPTAVLSTLPLRAWVDRLKGAGIEAGVSNSAGLYVCNQVFYLLQSRLARTTRRSGFIHVPLLPEQAKDGKPSMPFETMKRALEVLLEAGCEGRARQK